MAELSRVASITRYGYKELRCPFCGHFLKVKLYPNPIIEKKEYKCQRCKSKLSVVAIEEDEVNDDGSIRVNISATSAIKSRQKMILKKKI